MAVTKVGPDGQHEQIHCDWCKRTVETEDAASYGDNYHICDSCTLKFGQRASVIIESQPELAEKVADQIREQIEDQPTDDQEPKAE